MRELAKDLRFLNRDGPDRMGPLSQAVKNLQDYISPLVAERVESPKDDLISVVAEGERQGIFNRDMTINNVMLLLSAGHETTINLICNGTLAFTQHPDQWANLKSDPEGKTVRATEEALRYDSPVRSIQRIAVDDIEMNGQTIRKNDRVRWFIPGANRDPKVFDRADDFDIERYPNQHVAFGSGVTTVSVQRWPAWKGRRFSAIWPTVSTRWSWKSRWNRSSTTMFLRSGPWKASRSL